jgi:hypothetical protein
MWGLYLHPVPREATNLQESLLFYDPCCAVGEPQLSYMDTHAADLVGK